MEKIISQENGVTVTDNGDGTITLKNTTTEKKEVVGRLVEVVPPIPAVIRGIVENEVASAILRLHDEKGEVFAAYVEREEGFLVRDFRFLDLAKEWAEDKLGKKVDWQ